MNKIIIYILIFIFFNFIFKHFILSTKEGLENNCKTPSDAKGGCKTIAVEKNILAASYTKKVVENTKKEITDLMNKVSKLISSEEVQMNKNTDGIEQNAKHVKQMNAALKPDN
uniref:Uncharacterized protein n=1 Tax=viral metagenome TaxID=1070528 RepID=A0A6C0C3D1_9ZZZZ